MVLFFFFWGGGGGGSQIIEVLGNQCRFLTSLSMESIFLPFIQHNGKSDLSEGVNKICIGSFECIYQVSR